VWLYGVIVVAIIEQIAQMPLAAIIGQFLLSEEVQLIQESNINRELDNKIENLTVIITLDTRIDAKDYLGETILYRLVKPDRIPYKQIEVVAKTGPKVALLADRIIH